jgi:hypothetical protein
MDTRNMVCFRYIIVNIVHKGDNKDEDDNDNDGDYDDDDDDDDNNNNNNNSIVKLYVQNLRCKSFTKIFNLSF